MHIRSKISALGLSIAALSALAAPAQATITTFATYSQVDSKSNITWLNPVIPAVTKFVPAVTQTIPAVTQFIPAVTQFIPAVTKIVNGKVVVVTPAHTVIITPAHTVVITPAKTVVITPAHTVVVTPAHDGTSGTVFSTTAANSNDYGLAKVKFNFLNKVLAKKLGTLDANFSFQGAATAIDPALNLAGFLLQPDISGSFSFTYTGLTPLHVWNSTYLTGANLLSGTFTKLAIAGGGGASSGGMSDSSSGGGDVTFTSDFLDFTKTISRDEAFNLTSIIPTLGDTPGNALHSFKSSSGGAFSSDPAPRLTATVPEPATWALMLSGFGLAGVALRRRRTALAA